MNKVLALPKTLLFLLLFSMFLVGVDAQSRRTTAPDDELFRTIASLDGAVFEAYNRSIWRSLARSSQTIWSSITTREG